MKVPKIAIYVTYNKHRFKPRYKYQRFCNKRLHDIVWAMDGWQDKEAKRKTDNPFTNRRVRLVKLNDRNRPFRRVRLTKGFWLSIKYRDLKEFDQNRGIQWLLRARETRWRVNRP